MAATINISLKFGPMLIGVFFNMILYGILVMQVAYLFILETVNSAFDMAMMYEPLIGGFGSPDAVANFPTLFMTEPIIMALIACPIQFFFAWRIQRVTGIWWIPLIIAILALASCAGGIWTGIMVGVIKTFARKPELHTPALVWFLTSCVADILITTTLVRSLSQRKTGFVVTDSVIDKIIRTTVQTGMITAVCAVGDVAFFMSLEKTALNFIWDLMLSKLYANCLMSTLNARASLRGDMDRSGGNGPSSRDGRTGGLEPSMMSTRDRRQTTRFNQSHNVPLSPSAVYELENTKSFGGISQSSAPDMEYGITITKVVEHLEDPDPVAAVPRMNR
ncbi:hypothetical protein V5O48_008095 [Marasmius crinis-equi]|uniref:DUF6534 domain-containing protein n=1 Tax=Marasmius crinis-equi TaxID=585013 RepID=A0ABR3FFD6_9AGAR